MSQSPSLQNQTTKILPFGLSPFVRFMNPVKNLQAVFSVLHQHVLFFSKEQEQGNDTSSYHIVT